MRRLDAEESVAWGRVMATVRPLRAAPAAKPVATKALVAKPGRMPAVRPAGASAPSVPAPAATAPTWPERYEALFGRSAKPSTNAASEGGGVRPHRVTIVAVPTPSAPPNTLDGSWDRKLGRGAVIPDSAIDLHGHTLSSAHALLDQGLDRAIRRGDRVLLLVTGKPPRPESERPHARGAIRAAVADWLAASRHAEGIAAVRGAHPRHGGHGALYIVLRRPRG